MGSPADRRVAKTPQQYPAGGWMAEQRDDRVAVAIEPRRPPEDGHYAIGLRQLEERVHIVVGQAVSDRSQPLLRIAFRRRVVAATPARSARATPQTMYRPSGPAPVCPPRGMP